MQEALKGTWRLVSYEVNHPDGKIIYPYGKEAMGLLIYDGQGNMSVHIMLPDRPNFAVNDRWLGTPDEVQAAFNGYIAYYGRYSIDAQQGTVTHHVDGSVFPNYIGKKLVRKFDVSGDILVLSTPPMAFGGMAGVGRLTWVR